MYIKIGLGSFLIYVTCIFFLSWNFREIFFGRKRGTEWINDIFTTILILSGCVLLIDIAAAMYHYLIA